MSAREDLDRCPDCGETVDSPGSHGVGARSEGEDYPEASDQSKTCPNCEAELRRGVGQPWTVVRRKYRVVVRASHDVVPGILAGKGWLERGSSVTLTEEGLGTGSYEAHVSAANEDEARRMVEGPLAGQTYSIESVTPAYGQS